MIQVFRLQWLMRQRFEIWVSDESRFLLQKRDGRIRVYRRRNESFSSSCVQEVDSFGGGSVMMWAAISNDRKTDLVHVGSNAMLSMPVADCL
jgi:hypothetical protein